MGRSYNDGYISVRVFIPAPNSNTLSMEIANNFVFEGFKSKESLGSRRKLKHANVLTSRFNNCICPVLGPVMYSPPQSQIWSNTH